MSDAPSLLDYVTEADVDRLADVIADLLIAGARRQAAASDPAGSVRPLRAGDQPTMHNGSTSRPRDCAAVAEDSHRDGFTSAADEF